MKLSITDLNMTPEQLYRAVMMGERIESEQVGVLVPACLERVSDKDGERFVMFGVSGRHALNAAAHVTDAARLFAHWKGFKQIATAQACKEYSFTPEYFYKNISQGGK